MAAALPALSTCRPAGGQDHVCFHCGETNPAGARWRASVAGRTRAFCCAGCLALASLSEGAVPEPGFVEQRGRPNPPDATDRPALDAADPGAGVDDPAAAAGGLVRDLGAGRCEASLLLEGMTCGACAWLVERVLRDQAGVIGAQVNFAGRRAHVVFDAARTSLARIVTAVAAFGYAAHPYDAQRREALARREWRSLLLRAVVAVLAMMQVMMLALPTYFGDDVAPEQRRLLDWAALTLTLPVMLYCAVPLFRGAWRSVRAGAPGMDVPVGLALVAAFATSAWSTLAGTGATYYDSITMFVALLLVARLVELAARQRAAAALEAATQALPDAAQRFRAWPQDPMLETIGAAALCPGDVVQVVPGAQVPADGVVLEGDSYVEEAWLTGESRPLRKVAGDQVLAGAVNRGSALVIRVRAAGGATRLAAVARLAEAAALDRPRAVRLADLAARRFVTILLAVALVTGVVWWLAEPSRALAVTFALLVVSCPCALSLAAPAVHAAAHAGLARRGIVVTRADALETLARVNTVAFDKTGTLTLGRLVLEEVLAGGGITADEALPIAGALARASEHPLARALAAATEPRLAARNVRLAPGLGVEGRVDAHRWRLGRPDYVAALSRAPVLPPEAAAGRSLVALGDREGRNALFAFADAPRDDAAAAVAQLRDAGVAPVMLSGDRAGAAAAVAARVGIDDFAAGLLPPDKAARIAALQAQGRCVAMVGDGVNDAPALARADVAVSLVSATPLAQCTADVVLLDERLAALPCVLAHARKARRILRQNLAWALAYNALAIPAAALGLVTPLLASAGMSVSSLVVVLNAARALRVRSS